MFPKPPEFPSLVSLELDEDWLEDLLAEALAEALAEMLESELVILALFELLVEDVSEPVSVAEEPEAELLSSCHGHLNFSVVSVVLGPSDVDDVVAVSVAELLSSCHGHLNLSSSFKLVRNSNRARFASGDAFATDKIDIAK